MLPLDFVEQIFSFEGARPETSIQFKKKIKPKSSFLSRVSEVLFKTTTTIRYLDKP